MYGWDYGPDGRSRWDLRCRCALQYALLHHVQNLIGGESLPRCQIHWRMLLHWCIHAWGSDRHDPAVSVCAAHEDSFGNDAPWCRGLPKTFRSLEPGRLRGNGPTCRVRYSAWANRGSTEQEPQGEGHPGQTQNGGSFRLREPDEVCWLDWAKKDDDYWLRLDSDIGIDIHDQL